VRSELEDVEEATEPETDAEFFTYPGDPHLFTESSLADRDAAAAGLLIARILDSVHRNE